MTTKQYSFRNLFIMMLDRNLSNSDLAQLSGVSAASIGRLKRGKPIGLESLLKICEALNCNLDDIMEIKEK